MQNFNKFSKPPTFHPSNFAFRKQLYLSFLADATDICNSVSPVAPYTRLTIVLNAINSRKRSTIFAKAHILLTVTRFGIEMLCERTVFYHCRRWRWVRDTLTTWKVHGETFHTGLAFMVAVLSAKPERCSIIAAAYVVNAEVAFDMGIANAVESLAG